MIMTRTQRAIETLALTSVWVDDAIENDDDALVDTVIGYHDSVEFPVTDTYLEDFIDSNPGCW